VALVARYLHFEQLEELVVRFELGIVQLGLLRGLHARLAPLELGGWRGGLVARVVSIVNKAAFDVLLAHNVIILNTCHVASATVDWHIGRLVQAGVVEDEQFFGFRFALHELVLVTVRFAQLVHAVAAQSAYRLHPLHQKVIA